MIEKLSREALHCSHIIYILEWGSVKDTLVYMHTSINFKFSYGLSMDPFSPI